MCDKSKRSVGSGRFAYFIDCLPVLGEDEKCAISRKDLWALDAVSSCTPNEWSKSRKGTRVETSHPEKWDHPENRSGLLTELEPKVKKFF